MKVSPIPPRAADWSVRIVSVETSAVLVAENTWMGTRMDPPLLMISINKLQDGHLKDTAANILANEEFVVHIADEEIAAPMHHCGRNVPREVSELDEVGLTSTPSAMVKPPRIREAPVAFECRLSETIETSSRYIFIGQVVWLSARSGLVDTDRWRVNLRHYRPVARFGASYYIRTSDRFEIEDSQASKHHNQESFDRL